MKVHMGPYGRKGGGRKIRVQIDNCDVWGLDSTLAHIIVPALKKLKKTKQGTPYTDPEDAPHLPDNAEEVAKGEWHKGYNEARWEWIMNEMIWAFEQENIDWEEQYTSGEIDFNFVKVGDEGFSEMVRGPKHTFQRDEDGVKAHRERMLRGRMFFAKYYNALWD